MLVCKLEPAFVSSVYPLNPEFVDCPVTSRNRTVCWSLLPSPLFLPQRSWLRLCLC